MKKLKNLLWRKFLQHKKKQSQDIIANCPWHVQPRPLNPGLKGGVDNTHTRLSTLKLPIQARGYSLVKSMKMILDFINFCFADSLISKDRTLLEITYLLLIGNIFIIFFIVAKFNEFEDHLIRSNNHLYWICFLVHYSI